MKLSLLVFVVAIGATLFACSSDALSNGEANDLSVNEITNTAWELQNVDGTAVENDNAVYFSDNAISGILDGSLFNATLVSDNGNFASVSDLNSVSEETGEITSIFTNATKIERNGNSLKVISNGKTLNFSKI